MAKINGVIIPKASGSIGNITFRTAKRETVASEKIISNKSNTPAQAAQRATFRQRQVIAQVFRPIAKMAFKRNAWKTAYSKLSSAVMLAEDITNYAGIICSATKLTTYFAGEKNKIFHLADGDVAVNNVVYHRIDGDTCELTIHGTLPENIEDWQFDSEPENVEVRGCVVNNPEGAVPYPDFAISVEVGELQKISETGFTLKLTVSSYTELPTYSTPQEATYTELTNIPVPFISIAGQWLRISPWTNVAASSL